MEEPICSFCDIFLHGSLVKLCFNKSMIPMLTSTKQDLYVIGQLILVSCDQDMWEAGLYANYLINKHQDPMVHLCQSHAVAQPREGG